MSADDLSDGPIGHKLLYLPSLDHLAFAGLVCLRWRAILRTQVASFAWPISLRAGACDAALSAFVSRRFRKLTDIDLSCCRGLTDASARVVALLCPRLRRLDLTHCKLLSDAGITAIASSCPLLADLNLLNVRQVTGASHGDCV